jgi:hypothetical protein
VSHRTEIAQPTPAGELATTIDEALELLREFHSAGGASAVAHEPPASLLEQCLALCTEAASASPEPVRIVHHLACTGGTMISKCLAAMPNTQLVSEVDPLSTLQDKPNGPRFAPTDMIQLARQSTRGASRQLLLEMFLGNLELMHRQAGRVGQRLVLRDHAHSHFCSGPDIQERPLFRSIVASRFPVVSLVTVRHPIDSFVALRTNKFMHFQPGTFDEYCRRHLAFLAAHASLPIVKYEAFVEAPQQAMREMCGILDLPYFDLFTEVFSVFRLTGDSGRKGDVIEVRPRRPLDAGLQEEIAASTHYARLQEVLDYE